MPPTLNKNNKIKIFLVLLEKYIQYLVLETSKEAMRQRDQSIYRGKTLK
jgi:hypothetical protein